MMDQLALGFATGMFGFVLGAWLMSRLDDFYITRLERQYRRQVTELADYVKRYNAYLIVLVKRAQDDPADWWKQN